ncbi:MAG: trypsin-like peptidase domain-containing protein [Xenococcaceae cyanobacterium MO_167.B52]|nr:trypsin-like peptidase domain-containing protein [Xenococcaceae cyanobacterium MO_167.B52]
MSFYKLSTAIITTIAIAQPQLAIAQNISKINNIAENITVKITGYGNGSGVIFEKAGNVYSVVTNKHVVPIDANYEILTHDGTKHQVTSRIEIPNLDLAIVKFQSSKNYRLAKIKNSDSINPLQTIYVAGFPEQQTHVDIISGEIRSIAEGNQSQKGYGLIYTNQTLPGSSGGAVLDEKGNLIAINGLTKRDRKTGRDISRGIPINLFLAAKDSLKVNQEAIRVTIPLNTTITGFFNPNLSILGQVNSGQYQLAYTTNALHSSSVYSLAVSGDKIVSGSLDKTIKVWRLQ